ERCPARLQDALVFVRCGGKIVQPCEDAAQAFAPGDVGGIAVARTGEGGFRIVIAPGEEEEFCLLSIKCSGLRMKARGFVIGAQEIRARHAIEKLVETEM